MMIYPPITKLVEKTGSRYTLVIEAAKRARQISEGASPLTESDSNKEVSIATDEIFENKLEVFSRPVFTEDTAVSDMILDTAATESADAISETAEENSEM